MTSANKRLLGVIIKYHPNEQRGIINDVETHANFPFYCQHVYSDVLRTKLAETNRFNEKVFIRPNIYVTYTVFNTVNGEVAGKIELVESVLKTRDFGAPIIGYIQYFGNSNTGSGGLSGWINPQLGSDEQESSWFDITKVIDPALKAHLLSNADLKKPEWLNQGIQIRYWKTEEGRAKPTCIRIALVDDALRERWFQYYNIGEDEISTWEKERDKYLSVPNDITVPAYVEITAQRSPLTMQEVKMLNEFYKEAHNVTTSNPAQRGQLDFLWKMVERRQNNELSAALSKLPGINGTKLAIICTAACRYLDHHYADSIEMCYNAQRYDFAAELALSLGAFGIAQKLAEMAMDEEPTEKRIQMLGRVAIHTGNAAVFCGLFQEMLDACESGEDAVDECDLFAEAAIVLLGNIGIASDEMDEIQICCAVRANYNKPIPSFREMIHGQHESETVQASEQKFSIPEDRLKEPAYYVAEAETKTESVAERSCPKKPSASAVLLEKFKQCFMVNKSYRIPERSKDLDALPMIDELLNAELPSVNDYRMPLLVRLCLDPDGSIQYMQMYIKRLESTLDKKRTKYDKDRRWRLIISLIEYAQADNDRARSDAWEKAHNVVQGNDEPLLLSVLPH